MAVIPDTDLAARAAAVIPGGVNSGQRRVAGLEDLVVTATSGATFTDAGGRTYTDYHAAFGPPLLGHNDPDVDGAVAAAARSVGLMGVGVTPIEIELAEQLCELIPSVERVLLTETGSEATFHAIRVAYFQGRGGQALNVKLVGPLEDRAGGAATLTTIDAFTEGP